MVRVLACLAVLAAPCVVFGQGKLDRVREEVDRPRKATNNDNDTEDSTTTPSVSTDEEDEDFGFGAVVALAAATPWTMPNAMFDTGFLIEGTFTSYPYARPDIGLVLPNRRSGADPFDDSGTKWYSIRGAGEIGSDFDDLTRTGLRLFLDTHTRFGIKTDWDYYLERLPFGCYDELWIGDITGTYRFAQNEWIQMHTGLGARFLVDRDRTRGGFNFLYGFDYFPVEPAHIFASFEAGALGNAGLIRLHGGVGVNWRHGELFVGYDYLRIGGAVLQGPFAGLRLWF